MPDIVLGSPREDFQHVHGIANMAHTALGTVASRTIAVHGGAGMRLSRGGAGAQVFAHYTVPFQVVSESRREGPLQLRCDARIKIAGRGLMVLAGLRDDRHNPPPDGPQDRRPANVLMAWADFGIRANVKVEEDPSGRTIVDTLALAPPPLHVATTIWDHYHAEPIDGLVASAEKRGHGTVAVNVPYAVTIYVDLRVSGYCFTDTADPALLPHLQNPEASVGTDWGQGSGHGIFVRLAIE